MTLRTHLLPAALLALAACSGEQAVVIEELDQADESYLTVPERFEAAYVGSWHETGNCASGQDVLELSDDAFRYGDLACDIEGLSRDTAKVRVRLTGCEIGGEAMPREMSDRTFVFDLAGEDVLYMNSENTGRERLELCES